MVNFTIDEKIRSAYPEAKVAVVEGECTKNAFVNHAAFLEERKKIEEGVRAIPVLAEHPHIAGWRKVFKSFGVDPTKKRSSGEAIARRVHKGESLPDINAIVDVYNAISAKHVIPVGGHDLSRLTGNVTLRYAVPGDKILLLGATEPEAVDVGEVVYADEACVICSKWNYRDCENAKIADETTKFILFLEGNEGSTREEIDAAGNDIVRMLNAHVQGCSARLVKIEP